MLPGRLAAWEVDAEQPLLAALQASFPHKMEYSVQRAAQRLVSDVSRAWQSYEAGGSAAALDVLEFVTQHRLPLPFELSTELAFLAGCTLRGETLSEGRGFKPPLIQHRISLIKRLRYEHIQAILDDAALQAHEDDPKVGVWNRSGLSAATIEKIKGEREPASSVKEVAIRIAREQMPKELIGPTSLRAYRQDYEEVAACLAGEASAFWPGRFYLPSSSICESLGWGDLFESFQMAGVPSDAPYFSV